MLYLLHILQTTRANYLIITGNLDSKTSKEIYNKTHQKSEEKIDIPVKSSKDAEVQVYMNEDLVVHKIIKFD